LEYLVRPARITDIDRLVALGGSEPSAPGSDGPLDAADLLRRLVYLPQASIVVAEARRQVVGGAVLALRPSVRAGGFVGTIDFLVVDPDHDQDRVTAALVDEILRSASNKGCTVVETTAGGDAVSTDRWAGLGFEAAGPLMHHSVAAAGVAARSDR
jgi:predicted N-acetyltransferase YhbS